MSSQTAANAHGRWPAILAALGVNPQFLRNLHGPCPICGGRDRFRFDDNFNGKWICNQCGAGDGFDLLQRLNGWAFPEAAAQVDRVLGSCDSIPAAAHPKSEKPDPRPFMREIFLGSSPIRMDDPAWRYLEARGIDPQGLQDLRYHPALSHSITKSNHPGMVAIMRGADGHVCGVHRTFLTPDGNKAAVSPVRMALGDLGPVRLFPAGETLGIAEGIETAIKASQLFRMPVWAAICANGLKSWEPPEGVQSVVIFGDNDSTFTGQEAAYSLAKRLRNGGLSVRVEIPPGTDTDWAD